MFVFIHREFDSRCVDSLAAPSQTRKCDGHLVLIGAVPEC